MKKCKRFEDFYLGLVLYFASKRKGMLRRIRRSLLILKEGLAQESIETKDMFITYSRYSRGKASKEEMKIANMQFREVVTSLGLGVLLVLPFAPLTLPIVVKLGQKFGINIIPSAFRKEEEK
ncbi:hypothetical protein [Halobacteriovorax sp. JY17]|uniref:hypothetical protein n=1 Tax=Halobacteriovorax sp. JY17 TaxID=2014617 RepID=UPI000C461B0C|nr:hypothetical protein [Halobacteriovorax sp. JY17]PIK13567.1 MAG: hypothetical protein CES88_15365 [Halobacteriovorax sp. JY17]